MNLTKGMKQKIKKILPAWLLQGYRHIRFDAFDGYAARSYSQEGEDMILRRIFEAQKTGFYVDVGAHHPKRFSNTNYFYRRGWKGINIDPNPDSERLFRKYRPRDINLLCGISDVPGELTYFMFSEPALNTFSREIAESRKSQQLYRLVATTKVGVERLETVLNSHLPGGTQIDFMSIDAEGFDINVVHSNNWEKFRPKCVVVEALESSINDVLLSALHMYLSDKNYEFFAKTHNSLFYVDRNFQRRAVHC